MKLKNIINRDVVDLSNCANEPIHIPGSIQPHGFLLAITKEDWMIDFCSANSVEFTAFPYEQLLGKSFEAVFGEVQTVRLKTYILSDSKLNPAPLRIELNGHSFTCVVQKDTDLYILEFEPFNEENLDISDIYQQTKQFTFYLEQTTSLQNLCQSVADETRSITGYDRVMIYRFDQDYNGEVYAESRNENTEPFLGLHYPHSDIPLQARQLYIKNLLRLIVDVDYKPVPVYTIDSAPGKNLDLSLSTLRSVSPIHIQYLQNMGVAATLTISLMHEQKLWGLIACHHYTSKYLSGGTRIAAQLQGHFLTSQINVRQLAEEYEVAKKVNVALDELLAQLFSAENMLLDELIQQPAILALTNAMAVIMVVDDVLYTHGIVLPAVEIRKLVSWLRSHHSPTGFSTANLSALYPEAINWPGTAAGIIFHSVGLKPNDCIIWCRPEVLQEVHWAGDPNKAILKDEKGLSPRQSFERWKEVKKCESIPWEKPELIAAANFSNALQKHLNTLFLVKEELKQRKLSEKLKEANAELENLNWIGSHDLKEPLRKIQIFASRILNKKNEGISESIMSSVTKMSDSAQRMQVLIADILSYSMLGHIDEGFKMVDLDHLVKNIIADLSFELDEKSARVICNHLPAINGVPFLLEQLLVNLIRNGLKFSRGGIAPEINISFQGECVLAPQDIESTEKFYKIAISDNGIGFENKFKESIFKVFTRLHTSSEYSGSGVGLALCKKIMHNHKGYILAEGVPGEGALFTLYFPI